ncbi:MAG: DNA topoisomerase, partial [Patescibacteria group bacterium]
QSRDTKQTKTQIDQEKTIIANLYKINNESIPKLGIRDQIETKKIVDDLEKCEYEIQKIEKKETRKNPPAPFTTSTLQQEASKKLRFSAKQTMRVAQILYENGLITYMRTDSLNLSKESLSAAHEWIKKELGGDYVLNSPRIFKTKSKLAQEAHEAIRPTDPFKTPKIIGAAEPNEKKLYELIWRRFIASQLPQAVFDATGIDIKATQTKNPNAAVYNLKANGNSLRFDGFLKIWPQKFEEKELPDFKESEKLNLLEIKPSQHFTEPPARYNEANLIKILEENGVGRPSTYAPVISVIQDRNYVQKNPDRR